MPSVFSSLQPSTPAESDRQMSTTYKFTNGIIEEILHTLDLCEDALSSLARIDDGTPSISALIATRKIIDKIAKEREPVTSVRDFHGFRQHIEEFTVLSKDGSYRTIRRWMFYIVGFGLSDETANMLKSDGSRERVPIDDKGRITILGKKYSRKYWNH
jgi:hypothetical protein